MLSLLRKNWYFVVLFIAVAAYIAYFSVFTILRYSTLWAHYFDLGIMHQTVYNSYKAIQTQDWSRFLEQTNPFGPQQIKRMSIHNDMLLGLISVFYFIHAGPETLLILQSVVLGLGALAVYGIATHVLKSLPKYQFVSLLFALGYLLYAPMQRANIFDFHAVTIATSTLLFMYYFWLKKRYWWSFLFFGLSILTKEQVPLTTGFFAGFILLQHLYAQKWQWRQVKWKTEWFALLILASSLTWFILSMSVIIPMSRGGNHFALSYYGDFGDSPSAIILGLLKNPISITKYIFHIDTFRYFLFLLGPLGFVSLFAPQYLLIALPEFGINLLSNNWNMRNVVFHYTSVIQPFVFIASIYGYYQLYTWLTKRYNLQIVRTILAIWIVGCILGFAFTKGPLPLSQEADLTPFVQPKKEALDALQWSFILHNEKYKISTTGKLGPLFTSRRYFYTFSENYPLADYVIIYVNEIDDEFLKEQQKPAYAKLLKDINFTQVYKKDGLEVYKKN